MNKTKFSSRMTRRENPGAGGFSRAPRLLTDCGGKANVVHRKTSQQMKYPPDKILGMAAEKPPYAVCHLTMSINPGDWL